MKHIVFGLLLSAGTVWANVEVVENRTLDGDVDWREQGEVLVAAGKTLDLAGHQLSLSKLAGSGTITDTVGGGVLTVHVPRGVTMANTNVYFTGHLQLVKDGGGTFQQYRRNQIYAGGTRVVGGTLKGAEAVAGCCFGASGTTIQVDRGAVLDLWKSYDNTMWKYVLNGGTLREYDTTGNQSRGHTQISDLKLTADSYMDVSDSGFLAGGYGVTKVDLGGHQLSINGTGHKVVFLYHTTFTSEGTLRFTNGTSGYFQADKTAVDGSKISVINPGTSRFTVPTTFKNFECGTCDDRTAVVTVLGRFKSTGATLPNVKLANGATLDLTGKTGTWDLTDTTLAGTITYADGGTVTVDLDGRTDLDSLTDGLVLKWSAAPTNVTLVPDAVTASSYAFELTDAGLVIARKEGLAKTAVWTGAADGDWTDAANWSCTDFDDASVTAVPCSLTAVSFTETLPTQIVAGVAAYGKLSGAITLTADADWRGLSATVFADGCTLDLAGHTLTLTALRGVTAAGAIITDTVGGGELHLDVAAGAVLTGDKVRLTGAVKVVKNGAGVYVPTLNNQTYTGGTVACAGTVRMGGDTTTLGTYESSVRVEAGAVLDADGHYDFFQRTFELAGGDFVNTGSDRGNGSAQLELLTLEADATLDTIDFIGAGYRETTLNLGGHTLTLKGDENYLLNLTATNGTIYKKNGRFVVDKYSSGQTVSFRGATVNLDLDCILWAEQPMEIGNLTMRYTGSEVNGTKVVGIHGTYLPLSNYIHNFQLRSDSAIDLSQRTEAFNLTSATTGKTLAIDENARVTVKLGSREMGKVEKLIAWTSETQPPASVTYLLEDHLRESWKFSVHEDGLYAVYKVGTILYIR